MFGIFRCYGPILFIVFPCWENDVALRYFLSRYIYVCLLTFIVAIHFQFIGGGNIKFGSFPIYLAY
jgi:hypothetical protein